MKKTTYALLFILTSCSSWSPPPSNTFNSHFERQPSSVEPITFGDPTIVKEIQDFQIMVEEALVWRAKSLEFAEANAAKLKKERLNHQDIQNIHNSALEYVELRNKLMAFAYKYQDVVDDRAYVQYAPGERTLIEKRASMGAIDPNAQEQIFYRIDPTDKAGEELMMKMRISLNAALVLYDSYMIGIYPYYKSKKMRKLLNTDIKGHRFEFDKITDSFFNVIKRNKMHQAIGLFKADLTFKQSKNMLISAEESYLNLLATQSSFYNFMVTKYKPLADASAIRIYFDRLYDRSIFMNDFFTFTTSTIFGNTVGLVAYRKGMLTKISKDEKKDIARQMKPLDIMLEKTPFRLTDQFIPGHYGHVAIWAGTEEELKALGVWDHPSVAPYQEKIRSGHHIIEALRPGVQINTLDHFLNIDDMLVLRDESLNDDQRKDYLIRAFQQIGKDYDFNFDVETDKKIVCSEIVYVVFHNINWPTERALGRHTISPDHVVKKVEDNILSPVLMYTDGQKVQGDMKEKIKELVK